MQGVQSLVICQMFVMIDKMLVTIRWWRQSVVMFDSFWVFCWNFSLSGYILHFYVDDVMSGDLALMFVVPGCDTRK